MMKRFLSLVLALLLAAALTAPALAAGDADLAAAQELNALGLFAGVGTLPDGTPDFALGDRMNRMQAVTMLVRLLGREQAALDEKNPHPFSDVAAWADPYVGYAYANGLTLGQGGDRFGGSDTVNAQQFSTFVLRALGYSSETDFRYAEAVTFAAEAGLAVEQGDFDRGSAAALSRSALNAALAAEDRTLAAALVERGAVDAAVCETLHIPMTAEKPEAPAFARGDYPLAGSTLSADALLADIPGAKWVMRSDSNVDYYMDGRSETELPDRLLAAYLDSVAAYLAGGAPDADSALRSGSSARLRLDHGSDAFVFVLDADFVLLAWGSCCGADASVTLTAPAFDAAASLAALREKLAASLKATEISATVSEPDEYGGCRVYLQNPGDARYYAPFLPLFAAAPDEELRGTIIRAVPDILYVQKMAILLEDGTRIPMYFGEMLIERDETGVYIPTFGSGSKLFLLYGDDGVIESWCFITV